MAGAAAALGLVLALVALGARSIRTPETADGLPAPMAFLFAAIALLAAISDLRIAGGRALTGRQRLGRHLWRMCFALFIASASFFVGQTQVLPVSLRTPWVLAPPVLTPVLLMAYWLWRVRARGGLRSRTSERAPAVRG